MMNTKVILALGLALSSGAVLAQSEGDRSMEGSETNQGQRNEGLINAPVNANADMGEMFDGMDLNTDKILSLDEVTADSALSDAFSSLDTDRSGGLTNGEFAKFERDSGSGSGSGASASGSTSGSGSGASASGRSSGNSASGSTRGNQGGQSGSNSSSGSNSRSGGDTSRGR